MVTSLSTTAHETDSPAEDSPAEDTPKANDTRLKLPAETVTAAPDEAEPPSASTENEPEVPSGRWARLTENLMLPILGGAIAVMLGFVLTTTNARISDTNERISDTNERIDKLETRMNERIDKLETRMNERIDKLETRIDKLEAKVDSLDDKVDEISLQLTALIAVLSKTSEVDAAISGVVASADP